MKTSPVKALPDSISSRLHAPAGAHLCPCHAAQPQHHGHIGLAQHVPHDALRHVRLKQPAGRARVGLQARVHRATGVLPLHALKVLARKAANDRGISAVRVRQAARHHAANVRAAAAAIASRLQQRHNRASGVEDNTMTVGCGAYTSRPAARRARGRSSVQRIIAEQQQHLCTCGQAKLARGPGPRPCVAPAFCIPVTKCSPRRGHSSLSHQPRGPCPLLMMTPPLSWRRRRRRVLALLAALPPGRAFSVPQMTNV